MGTKEQFRNWLTGRGMTYSRYTSLSIPDKAKLYAEYQAKGRKAKPPQDDNNSAPDRAEPVAA
jgi:hypothetical protein